MQNATSKALIPINIETWPNLTSLIKQKYFSIQIKNNSSSDIYITYKSIAHLTRWHVSPLYLSRACAIPYKLDTPVANIYNTPLVRRKVASLHGKLCLSTELNCRWEYCLNARLPLCICISTYTRARSWS